MQRHIADKDIGIMSNVLVTGGGGFIGWALAEALAARGDTAIAFDVAHPAAAASPPPNIKVVQGDVTDAAGIIAAMRAHRVDKIIHAAAIVGIAPSRSMATTVVRVNLEGSINVFEAARILGLGRVIHVSSEEVYGRYATPTVDEDSPAFPLAPYGATKLATEHFGRSWRDMYGLEVINLRIAWIYGPRLPRARVPKILVDAAVGGYPLHLPTGGDSRMDHTYVDDVVAGIIAALDHAEHPYDTYNLGTGVAHSVRELVEMLKSIARGAAISVGPGEIQHPGGFDMPRKGALDSKRAATVFGFSPRFDLRAGLQAYVDALRRTP
jgi:UDP-glucose 4-epimerase